MGRAVTPVRPRQRGATAQAGDADSYTEKLVKFFPIETSGPYVMASGVIMAMTKERTAERTAWLLIVFVILLFFTIALLARQYPKSLYSRRWFPILFGTGAYIVWCYSLNSLPQELDIYSPIAVVILPILYAVGASFNPTMSHAKPAQQPKNTPA